MLAWLAGTRARVLRMAGLEDVGSGQARAQAAVDQLREEGAVGPLVRQRAGELHAPGMPRHDMPNYVALVELFRAVVAGRVSGVALLDVLQMGVLDRICHRDPDGPDGPVEECCVFLRGHGRGPPSAASFGYGYPTALSLGHIVRYVRREHWVLELGAGLGAYACVGRCCVTTWIATDHPHAHASWPEGLVPFYPVVLTTRPFDEFQAMCDRGPDVLFISWPDPDARWPLEHIRAFRGELVVIVGHDPMTGGMGHASVIQHLDTVWEPICLERVARIEGGGDDTVELVLMWRRRGAEDVGRIGRSLMT